jgi:hypothetical protein
MVCLESGYVSLNKYKEELCGDRVEIINGSDCVTMVLADGLGSGVKANILATLTSKIIGTMIANGLGIGDAVETIAQTLPVCSQRKIAYSTFSILTVKKSGFASLIQFDNPSAIFLRGGKCVDYAVKQTEVYGKTILESNLQLQKDDMLLLISDGVVHAGVGRVYNLGWQLPNIQKFVSDSYCPGMTAKSMAALLAGACRQLYMDMPGDDATVAVMRVRNDVVVNVMAGPPVDRANDEKMVQSFLAAEGKKIICGGTTSQIVARYLGENIETKLDYPDPKIPPVASIKGIDLTTEGVLTMSRALELCEGYHSAGEEQAEIRGKDGASLLAKMLLEEATSINFYIGKAINPAHQNPEFPSSLSIKLRLVNELVNSLKYVGKQVNVYYY